MSHVKGEKKIFKYKFIEVVETKRKINTTCNSTLSSVLLGEVNGHYHYPHTSDHHIND